MKHVSIQITITYFDVQVRGAILAYTHELVAGADGQLSIGGSDDVRHAVSKVGRTWAFPPETGSTVELSIVCS